METDDDFTTAEVDEFPICDFCEQRRVMRANDPRMSRQYRKMYQQHKTTTRAAYDGATQDGPWAFMCHEHFSWHGVGLGLGKGQRLVLRGGKSGA